MLLKSIVAAVMSAFIVLTSPAKLTRFPPSTSLVQIGSSF